MSQPALTAGLGCPEHLVPGGSLLFPWERKGPLSSLVHRWRNRGREGGGHLSRSHSWAICCPGRPLHHGWSH